jgi:anti-repressor protein
MNNELIKITEHDGEQVVSARELYEFLEVKRDFTNWCKQMFEYGFEEQKDFTPIMAKSTGGRPSVDYALCLDMAKEISMLQRTDKGKQARQYFIQCEKAALAITSRIVSKKELAQMVIDAENQKDAALLLVAKQQPSVDYVRDVLKSESAYTIKQIASELGLTAQALNKILQQNGVQYKVRETWILYAKYIGNGYTKSFTFPIETISHGIQTKMNTVWTEKGRVFIHTLVNPVMIASMARRSQHINPLN